MLIKSNRILKGLLISCLGLFLCVDVSAKKCTESFGLEMKNDNKGTITITADSGQFKVLIKTNTIEEKNFKAGENLKIKYDKDIQQTIKVYAVYTGDYSCYPDTDGLISDIKAGKELPSDLSTLTYKAKVDYLEFIPAGKVPKSYVANTSYNGICAYLRSGTWPNESDKENYDIMSKNINVDDYLKYNKNISYPYCYNETVDIDLPKATVAKSISARLKAYKSKVISSTVSQPVIPTGAKTFNLSTKQGQDEFSKGISEKCSAIFPDGYTKTKEYQYTNSSKYYAYDENTEKKVINNKQYTCKKRCSEELVVEYGPPVATKAGLCFEYRVKVKSTVTCTSEAEGNPPEPSDYEVCEPVAYCNNTSSYSHQAGPNDDFDSCILDCDNGKYSQKCINRCYTKIYGNGKSMNLSYTAKKIANSDKCQINGYYDAANLYQIITNGDNVNTKNEFGYYYRDNNGVIHWQAGTHHYTEYARYYFSSLSEAQRTVRDDYECGTGSYYAGDGCNHFYSPKNGGFKWSAGWDKGGNKSPVSWCNNQCEYLTDGCDNNAKLNKSDVSNDYKEDLEDYTDFINDCTAKASCSEKTANFTIKVNNKTKDNNENWIDYDTATITNRNLMDASNVVIDRSGCYGEGNDQNKYMTEWSFPGTWINVKTGEISYTTKPSSSWTKYDRKFCTNLKSANVNEDWWRYGVTKNKDDLTEKALENIEYNIKANAKDFGHYSWNIDVSCFYALKENKCEDCTCDCTDPTCTDPTCDNPNKNGDKNSTISYRVRSVDNSDLFPQASGEETTDKSSAGRTPGFNWTSAAQNLKNSNYIVAPDALISKIQAQGDDIYSDDKNIDYEFYLDRKALAAIRSYSKENDNNYTKFGGTSKVVNGVLVYESKLFRGTGSKLDSSYAKKRGIIGCNNQENDSCYNFPQLVSGIGG